MRKNKGFTLIELVAVIVILGILAVTAVPQFLDLRNDARNATAAGVGAAIASATANNYAKGLVGSSAATVIAGCSGSSFDDIVIGATSNSSIASLLTVNGVQFHISGSATGLTNGASSTCQIRHTDSASGWQNFTIVGCADTRCGGS